MIRRICTSTIVDEKTGARNVFTWNRKRFPNPAALFAKLRKAGIRVTANIKPWLLSQHPMYSTMVATRGFVWDCDKDAPSVMRFWSAGGGDHANGSYFDFTSPAAWEFWTKGVSSLLDMGIESVWNDNNEFGIHDDMHTYAMLNKTPVGLAGRTLQTFLMAKCSYDALVAHNPKRRPFLITRSGSPGIHRYISMSWSGDNTTSWNTLKHNIPTGIGAGLSLLPFYGHDVGGFFGPRPSPELFVRWTQSGIFHPRFTIHSWKDEGITEPWMYPEVGVYVFPFRSSLSV